MNVIAVNSPNISTPPDVALTYFNGFISNWANNNTGWVYTSFTNYQDLIINLIRLTQASSEKIESLEIVAHGCPVSIDSMFGIHAQVFGLLLNKINVLYKNANIILTGCNTGLIINNESISQLIR